MRNAFIEELVKLAVEHSNIALVVGDLGFSVIEPFADQFPDRFINAGVAEQNMVGLAAGMASEGYHVFTYSIANFPTFRCAEQLRNDVDYHKLPVTTVAVGGGVAYGSLGYSHHAVQDYALMRCMPNMMIAAPGDPMEVRACLRYLVENPQPSYLRIGKAGEKNYHKDVPKVRPGVWLPQSIKNEKKIILATGATIESAFNLRNVNSEYEDYSIYSLPIWGMKSKDIQETQVLDGSRIVTIEEHLTDGGFGSWLMESSTLFPKKNVEIKLISLNPKICGMVGSQKYLLNCSDQEDDVCN